MDKLEFIIVKFVFILLFGDFQQRTVLEVTAQRNPFLNRAASLVFPGQTNANVYNGNFQQQFRQPSPVNRQPGGRRPPPNQQQSANNWQGAQFSTFPNNQFGQGHWSHAHRPAAQHYRDFMSVFHDMDFRVEASNFSKTATEESEELEDDFNGRSAVAAGQYPHMAAIGFLIANSRQVEYKCGGSLISDSFVLTAAHCCNNNGQSPYLVKLGDINLDKFNWDLVPQLRRVYQYFLFPDYNTSLHYDDIALLQLENPIEWTPFVRPIRLWASEEIPYDKVFTMGFGSTSFGQAQTNILTELDLSIVELDNCNATMPKDPGAPSGIIDSQICAKDFEKNRDTCQGDSGGPLQLNLERRRHHSRSRRRHRYYLVGIISYGSFCRSKYPGIYTRVSSYIDWIASIVWPDNFKNFHWR